MTVSSSTNRASYSGNGALTTFAYGFKVFDQDELTVILRSSDGTETVQTITTNYTVTGVGAASGGNVVFGSAPASGVTIVILRELDLDQGLDLVPNDPFPAQSLEDSLDKLTFMVQQHNEELGRTIKASRTNVIAGSEFTILAADRANKIFAFDGSGNVSIAQEIGTYRGNWASGALYNQRDLVKDTSTNNIFMVKTAHTSSGSQPITTNTDAAKWDLIIDAASATTSATAAAASESAAETAETNAETARDASIAAKDASVVAKDASVVAKDASVAAKDASVTAKNSSESALASFTGQYATGSSDPSSALNTGDLFFNSSTNLMKVYNGSAWIALTPSSSDQTNINALAASAVLADMAILATDDIVADMAILGTNAVVADMAILATDAIVADMAILATDAIVADMAILGTDAIVADMAILATSAIVADMAILATNDVVADMNILATSDIVTDMNVLGTSANVTAMSNVSGSIGNVNTVASNISSVNNFAAQYRIASSDPSDSLNEGDLVYNTSSDKVRVYNGSAWQDVAPVATSINVSQISDLTASAAELNYNDITTLGTVQASKVVTADANGDVKFPDNEKAIFGAGDLEIFHDSSNSYIKEVGAGDLIIMGDSVNIRNAAFDYALKYDTNAAVTLYYDNAVKLATTATGAAITGAVKPTTYQETYIAKSAASTVTCDLATGTHFSVTVGANTTFAFSNPPSSGTSYSFLLIITQHSTAVTLTWPSTVDWAGGAAPAVAGNNEVQAYGFVTRDGGTTYYGFLGGTAIG